MTYESEVLADKPVAYFRLDEPPGGVPPWPVGQKFTYGFGQPYTSEGEECYVVVDLDTRSPVAVYVNGEKVPTDHRYAAEFMARWTPPKRLWPDGLSLGDTGSGAIYDKPLTAEQIAAHYTAYRGD